jgi:hypothetical protein
MRSILEIAFSLGLVAENAKREIGDIEATERVDGVREQIRMVFRAVEIDDSRINEAGAARACVSDDRCEAIGVAPNEEQMIAAVCPQTNAGLGDA